MYLWIPKRSGPPITAKGPGWGGLRWPGPRVATASTPENVGPVTTMSAITHPTPTTFVFLCVLMITFGYLWVFLVTYEYLWIPMSILGYLLFLFGTYVYLCVHMISFGYLWLFMSSYGFNKSLINAKQSFKRNFKIKNVLKNFHLKNSIKYQQKLN